MKYETVIGLEVHVQLRTKSKIFCSCPTTFGAEPNENTCPVCLGLPGSLPVLNKRALELGVQVGLALGCKIANRIKFDRKNYFYPDLPKAYQISQFDMPVCGKGSLTLELKDEKGGLIKKTIGITRAHLEEDAGKLIHEGVSGGSWVDYNRAGTPLLEIVSEPDLRTPEEAFEYLTHLKAILQYLDVSDCNMEEGSLRCDANVSLRKWDAKAFGTKVEIKNMNSFHGVRKALEYEQVRQEEALESGGALNQETRLWNESKSETFSMRSKEFAHDYRYFPEPDLVPFTISPEQIQKLAAALPELPKARFERFQSDYKLSRYDAQVLVGDKELGDYFESCVKTGVSAKLASNWIQSELLGELSARKVELRHSKVGPKELSELIRLIEKGTISGKIAKEVLPMMFENGNSAESIVQEKGLVQVTDTKFLEEVAERVIASNPKSSADVKSGKKQAIGFLVGQVMKETKGKANPKLINEILQKKLS
jgi:aspartyl-tRNA(Asn)/glutamyl-tRNA(Gln) amidotransferase subunit B